jgi:putative transcriptional regulator
MNNNVKTLRQQAGFTQQQLADELSVSRQTINSIETEKYDPSLQLAFSIALFFGVKIEDVFHP